MSHDPDGEYQESTPITSDSDVIDSYAEQQLAISRRQLELQRNVATAVIEWLETMAREAERNRAEVQAEAEMLAAQQPDPWGAEYRNLMRESVHYHQRQATSLESIAESLRSITGVINAAAATEAAAQRASSNG